MSSEVEERIAFTRDQLERGVNAVGALHHDVILARIHHGIALNEGGFTGLALEEFSRAAMDACAVLGATHPDALVARYHESSALILLGNVREAEAGLDRLLADHLAAFGPKHVGTFSVRSQLANVLIALDRPDEAEEQLSMLLLEAEESGIALEPGQRASWLLQLSHCLAMSGRFEHAADVARASRLAALDPQSGKLSLAIVAQARLVDTLFGQVMSQAGVHDDRELDDLLDAGLFAVLEEMHRQLDVLREDLARVTEVPEMAPGGQHWITVRLAEISAAGIVEDAASSAAAALAFGEELMLIRGPDRIALSAAGRIGQLLSDLGGTEQAILFLESVVDTATRSGLGRTGPVLVLRNDLGQHLFDADRPDEAVLVLRAAVDDAMQVPDEPGVDRATIARNLLDRATMVSDRDAMSHGEAVLRRMGARAEGVVETVPPLAPSGRGDPSTGPRAERVLDILANGASPQAAQDVAEAVVACAVVGRPVLIERHVDGWYWALAAPSIDELTSTLRLLDPEAEDLPAFVVASRWIVRDGMTSWRPRPGTRQPLEWWLLETDALSHAAGVLARVGGDR